VGIFSSANIAGGRRALQNIIDTRAPTSNTCRFLTNEQEKHFHEMGCLDKQGMTAFNTLHELQVNSTLVYSENELFGTYNEESKSFQYMTYSEYNEKVNQCRALLKDLGVEEYGKVAIISNNRWEWAVIGAATYSLNATLVPMYEAQLPSDWTYILNDSGSVAIFCATEKIFQQVRKEVLPSTPTVRTSLCLDAPLGEPHAFQTALSSSALDDTGSLIIAPTPEDLAGLIYTSGTTGKPKVSFESA